MGFLRFFGFLHVPLPAPSPSPMTASQKVRTKAGPGSGPDADFEDGHPGNKRGRMGCCGLAWGSMMESPSEKAKKAAVTAAGPLGPLIQSGHLECPCGGNK